MKELTSMVLAIFWVAGVVLAKGFWLTTFAIVMPFYAWYLVAERAMQMAGII